MIILDYTLEILFYVCGLIAGVVIGFLLSRCFPRRGQSPSPPPMPNPYRKGGIGTLRADTPDTQKPIIISYPNNSTPLDKTELINALQSVPGSTVYFENLSFPTGQTRPTFDQPNSEK